MQKRETPRLLRLNREQISQGRNCTAESKPEMHGCHHLLRYRQKSHIYYNSSMFLMWWPAPKPPVIATFDFHHSIASQGT
jgi:hypothetical protein